jgi:hypothetical protein
MGFFYWFHFYGHNGLQGSTEGRGRLSNGKIYSLSKDLRV